MAITPTPNNSLFKGFVFDGVDSRDYGVYISGDAVFNAPERDVEMIEIPGRNGAFALDKGRFSNIEVTYHAGLFGATEADFAAGINALRNALASRKGYCRLEDDYNQNEYRMAVYKSGLDVTPAMLKAGEFDIVFECKPQRFLKSGETEQTVTSGGSITNPTLFEAKPLLQVWGYGDITINGGEPITINDQEIGTIILANAKSGETNYLGADRVLLRNTDIVTLGASDDGGIVHYDTAYTFTGFSYSVSGDLTSDDIWLNVTDVAALNGALDMQVNLNSFSCEYGETDVHPTITITAALNFASGSSVYTVNFTITPSLRYQNSPDFNAFTFNCDSISYDSSPIITGTKRRTSRIGEVTGYSTKPTLGEPLYFDMDIGEAYKEEDGEIVSVNNAVSFPAELPTLKSGANTITYDNTVTQLKIVPRWWEV